MSMTYRVHDPEYQIGMLGMGQAHEHRTDEFGHDFEFTIIREITEVHVDGNCKCCNHFMHARVPLDDIGGKTANIRQLLQAALERVNL